MSTAIIDLVTPHEVYDRLDQEFHFTLDAAATPRSAKCRRFYTPEMDGLAQNWEGETVFCHPPADDVAAWAKKCAEEGAKRETTVVLFTVARTEAGYFHEHILGKSEIRYLKGRTVFMDPDGERQMRPSAGSMVAIYRGPLEGGIKTAIVDTLSYSLMTSGEVHDRLCRSGYRVKINGVTSRLSELKKAGRIRAVGRRVCKTTGKAATVWAAVEV